MRTETMEVATSGGATTAHIIMPDEETRKAVMVIQEWWGLNEHVRDIAGRYAKEGFIAIAPDLYRGHVATNSDDASKMMHDLALEDGIETIRNSVAKAKEQYEIEGLGITGFCMGGTFALRAACDINGFAAAAPFYGDIPEIEVLKKLKIPTIFVSGTRDGWITPEKVAGLEATAAEFSLPIRLLKYDADHAFFNDTRPDVYDAGAARDAWQNVVSLYKENL